MGKNRFECMDGTKAYCSFDEECFATAPFIKGHWADGCRALTPAPNAKTDRETHAPVEPIFIWTPPPQEPPPVTHTPTTHSFTVSPTATPSTTPTDVPSALPSATPTIVPTEPTHAPKSHSPTAQPITKRTDVACAWIKKTCSKKIGDTSAKVKALDARKAALRRTFKAASEALGAAEKVLKSKCSTPAEKASLVSSLTLSGKSGGKSVACEFKLCTPICKEVTKYIAHHKYKIAHKENSCVDDQACLKSNEHCKALHDAAAAADDAEDDDGDHVAAADGDTAAQSSKAV